MTMFSGGAGGGSAMGTSPVSLAGGGFDISSLLSLFGTGAQAFGQYQQLNDAQKIAEFNSMVALQDAKLRKQAAQLELTLGKKQKNTYLAKQRSQFAKAGVTSAGTPFDAIVESAANIELGLQIDYFNAQIGVNRAKVQSELDTAQASGYEREKIVRPLTTILTSRAFQNVVKIGY